MTITEEEFYRLCNAIRNARDWADQGHPEAVWSYLDEADSILDNKKDSVPPEPQEHPHSHYSLNDLPW